MQDDETLVRSLVGELTTYLSANPFVSDSAEGIARWWLKPDSVVDPLVLDVALRVLQAQGFVETVTSIDGRVRYRGLAPRDWGGQHDPGCARAGIGDEKKGPER